MVGKMIIFDEAAFRAFFNSPTVGLVSRIVLLIVGIGYGAISIASNAAYILSFDSSLLRFLVVPALFIVFGLVTALITKVGLTLLLWAAARGFGGRGLLKQVGSAAPVSLIPGLLSVPYLAGAGNVSYLILSLFGIVWMYIISVKIVKTTQGFKQGRACIAVFFAFLFLASIYYLVVPTT
ncbi:hypothetical protein E2R51_13005 [Jeotgalibacillus sp. S-D1]|uniref:hypothetical protein n=1 Tax=Jeotgalibacillus sp. S-D1 TaxID=2552189 RepID=UPI00105950FF|nr:hypothetical protein [Jeotgalibacillus sp. S-D1]TDL31288.1 hypothetical protein E2R51_13005 [Jeotgalibacillus sp. S-D1]